MIYRLAPSNRRNRRHPPQESPARAAIGLCIVLIVSHAGAVRSQTPPRPPNLIVILADDLGYGDVCAYGCDQRQDAATSTRLAASGVRFTQGYVTAPVCSPSRSGLMTGRYQQRYGHEFNPGGRRARTRSKRWALRSPSASSRST